MLLQKLRAKQTIQKLLALVMILLLVQKAGVGLYIHSWLHSKALVTNEQKTSLSFTCGCTDDFCMPFEEASDKVSFFTEKIYAIHEVAPVRFCQQLPLATTSLRGPPSRTV